MKRVKLAEMIPLDAPSKCPYNCAECKHLKGVVRQSWGKVEVQCDLDEYIIDCMISKK